jgi:hypothetical protein
MTTGSTMPIVTTIDAGATAAAALHAGVPVRTAGAVTAAMINPHQLEAWTFSL